MENANGKMTNALEFSGVIIKARGGHKELRIPGRKELPIAPADWPEILFPGSLNVLLGQSGYPPEMSFRRLPLTVKSLDVAGFQPEFVIEQELMGNNKLTRTRSMPNRGTAQVWRCKLSVRDQDICCWVLRRFGSGLDQELEIVSGEGIRSSYGLPEEKQWLAKVRMFGNWAGDLQYRAP